MSHDLLLTHPTRGDLHLVADLVDAAVLRLKTSLVKRCGGDVPVRPDPPDVRQLKEVLLPADELAIGAAAPFTLSAQNLRGLVILDVPLVQRCVGLFLGEPASSEPVTGRRLTRLDLQMARWICGDIVDAVVSACTVTRMTATVGEVHTNPRSVTALPQSPAVVLCELELGPEDAPFGRASVVLPAQASGVLWPERRRQPAKRKARTRDVERVKKLSVPVVAEVIRRRITLRELRGMEVGHTIELGSLRDVQVRIGGRPTLEGEAGDLEGVRCVRVTRQLGPQGPAPGDR